MSRVLLYALWLALPLLQGAIVHRMWIRRLHREYPLFFAYTISHLIRFAVLFYCYHLGIRDLYRDTYISLEMLNAVLKFGVICELFFHVFQPYEGVRGLGSALLRWASAILILIAVIVAALSPGSDSDKFLAGFYAMERSVEIVQGGLLFLLFLLSSSLGLRWKQNAWGIALGFGVVTSVDLAAFTLRAQSGIISQDTLSLVSNAAYDCAVIVWLVTLYA
ncbi:MAG TPA: hypothetical protein VGV15_09335, partial [Terriglobales bacterium]|nr:hypothetical protein [Terriglobales bacterium]